MRPVTPAKNLSLEGLRGIASLVVAIGHFTYVFFPYLGSIFRPYPGAKPEYAFEHWLRYPPFSLAFSADAAVSIFFVMSGFVLISKYFTAADGVILQEAAAKRYIRLVLPCFASVMLAWVLFSTGAIITHAAPSIVAAGWVSSWYVGPFPFAGSVFNGLVGAPLFANTLLNPPLWTIQIELIGSILLFSMFALFGGNMIWLCFWFVFFADLFGYQSANMLYYLSFFIGAMLNPARIWLQTHQTCSALLIGAGLIGVAFNQFYLFYPLQALHLPNLLPHGPDFNTTPRIWWNTIGAVCLVAGVIGSRGAARILSARGLVFLGKISFSVYIVHIPILMSVGLRAMRLARDHGCSYPAGAILAFVVFLITVLGVATLFQKFVDRPAIKLADFVARRIAVRRLERRVAA